MNNLARSGLFAPCLKLSIEADSGACARAADSCLCTTRYASAAFAKKEHGDLSKGPFLCKTSNRAQDIYGP